MGEAMTTKQKHTFGIDSFTLHVLAMALMLGDHLWATMFPGAEWLTCIGRLAFPLFAFMIAEGYAHTSNIRKYILRMLVFAVLSEVPFDLIYGGTVFYPIHQNVLWTFLIALCTMALTDRIRVRFAEKRFVLCLMTLLTVAASFAIGAVAMVDYYGPGVLTVLVFHYLRGRKWYHRLLQLGCLAVLHIGLLGGFYYTVTIADHAFEIVQQGFALFALIPIWSTTASRATIPSPSGISATPFIRSICSCSISSGTPWPDLSHVSAKAHILAIESFVLWKGGRL